MNTQIYLLLVKQSNLPTAAAIPMLLKNAILGDSLDVPFLKFIRVRSIRQTVEFEGETELTEVQTDAQGVKSLNVVSTSGNSAGSYAAAAGTNRSGAFGMTAVNRNNFTNINLPAHSAFGFTKSLDNATPQLAYSCTAQSPFSHAVFFFRRRIGAGIAGVRMPFMCIWLKKCLISGWSMSGDSENVSLKYREITWATFDQLADINIPTGMSARVWNTESKEGGEKPEVYAVQMAVAAIFAAGTAAWGLTDGSHGVQSG